MAVIAAALEEVVAAVLVRAVTEACRLAISVALTFWYVQHC